MIPKRRPAGERFFEAACRHCQRTFTNRIDRPQKCCSKVCAGEYRAARRPPCEHCGKVRTYRDGGARYCSKQCANEGFVKVRPVCPVCQTNPVRRLQKTCSAACGYRLRKSSRTERPCAHCQKPYLPYPSAIGRGARYCSRQCYNASVAPRPALLEVACAHCGTTFRRTRAAIARTKASFCSNLCKTTYLTGPQNASWRGGESRRGYRGPGWQRIAEEARERDGRRCRRCGKPEAEEGRRLSVDHIIPYRTFGTPKEANVPTNLVALCGSCHSKKARAERLWLKGDVLDMWTYQVAVSEPWKATA